jgi:hypothetical protein
MPAAFPLSDTYPMKSKLCPNPALLLAFAIWLTCLGAAQAQMIIQNNPAQSQLEVIATNGAGKETHGSSINGIVPMVMVRQNQTVPVTLQFPTDAAGRPVGITALDGGTISGGTPAILPTGKFVFTFSPGAAPGRYRVLVRMSVEEHLLEFYVVDPANPSSRPRSVR